MQRQFLNDFPSVKTSAVQAAVSDVSPLIGVLHGSKIELA